MFYYLNFLYVFRSTVVINIDVVHMISAQLHTCLKEPIVSLIPRLVTETAWDSRRLNRVNFWGAFITILLSLVRDFLLLASDCGEGMSSSSFSSFSFICFLNFRHDNPIIFGRLAIINVWTFCDFRPNDTWLCLRSVCRKPFKCWLSHRDTYLSR